MATPPARDHRISLQDAIGHTARFRAANPDPKTEKAAMFWRAGGLDELFGQPGCAGFRIYYGRKPTGAPALVLVGVDAKGADLTSGTIMEEHLTCPPFCGLDSPLAG